MSCIKKLFTEHPHSIDESYLEHGWFAITCGLKLFLLGLIAIIHAIFPFLFVHTTSEKLDELYCHLKARKLKE